MSTANTDRLTDADILFNNAIANLSPGDIAIDCGANVGKFTLEMAETGAEVFAFEPDELILPSIRRRISGFNNVQLIHAAVGIRSGKIRLLRSKNYHNNQSRESKNNTTMDENLIFNNSKTSQTFTDGEAVDVELVDLPKFIEEKVTSHGKIALLKIDIEGAEVELLEVLLARKLFDNIDLTVVETHEFLFPDLAKRYASLKSAIRNDYESDKVNFDWR